MRFDLKTKGERREKEKGGGGVATEINDILLSDSVTSTNTILLGNEKKMEVKRLSIFLKPYSFYQVQ